MLTHTATVRGRAITWDHREVVQHGLNADRVELVTDREWQECDSIVAVLAKTGAQAFRVEASHGFFIPSALMEDAGPLRMCLIGYAGDALRVVTAKEVSPLVVVESGETGGMDPTPEQPDLWAQLMEEVRKATDGAKTAAQSATRAEADLRAAAERGDFDGEDGKTPVRGVDYWTAEDRKPIEDATLAATTAAGRADAAAATATEGEASRVAAEAERANAEAARAKAEQAREGAETGRVEAEKVRVIADAERGERVDAAVQKADAATARATKAAGKATASATEADAAAKRADEAAKGASENVLVGTETATVVHVEDAWPTLLRECKVLGKSEQIVTTGKNMLDVPEKQTLMVDGSPVVFDRDAEGYVSGGENDSRTWGYDAANLKLHLDAGKFTLTVDVKKPMTLEYGAIRIARQGMESVPSSFDLGRASRQTLTFNIDAPCEVGLMYKLFGAVIRLQLEKGATATAYEPYTGGKPSPSPDFPQPITSVSSANLIISGANLFRLKDETKSGVTLKTNADGSIELSGTPTENGIVLGTDYIPYTERMMLNTGIDKDTSSDNRCVFQTNYTDKNKVQINYDAIYTSGKSVDAVPGTAYIKMQYYIGNKETFRPGTYRPWFSPVPYRWAPPSDYKMLTIDLQGHELYGFDNELRDELSIDANGDVTLIKRIFKLQLTHISHVSDADSFQYIQYTPSVRPPDGTKTMMSDRFIVGRGPHCIYTAGGAGHASIYVTFPLGTFASAEEYNAWLDAHPTEILYDAEEPQTIPLGKVQPPALPESTSNAWNADAITTDVSATYVRDVNIAFSKLESKLTQAVVATAANL